MTRDTMVVKVRRGQRQSHAHRQYHTYLGCGHVGGHPLQGPRQLPLEHHHPILPLLPLLLLRCGRQPQRPREEGCWVVGGGSQMCQHQVTCVDPSSRPLQRANSYLLPHTDQHAPAAPASASASPLGTAAVTCAMRPPLLRKRSSAATTSRRP